jgi:hypothetical protein
MALPQGHMTRNASHLLADVALCLLPTTVSLSSKVLVNMINIMSNSSNNHFKMNKLRYKEGCDVTHARI